MSLADSLKTMRMRFFFTQEKLAKELNVALSTVNRWETGESRPNLTTMKAVKKFCENHECSYSNIEKEWLNCNTSRGKKK